MLVDWNSDGRGVADIMGAEPRAGLTELLQGTVKFEDVVNHSILQTLDRSINTQLTVLFTLAALILFGGITVQHFVVTLFIGILSGSYSSIFNASPLLVVWENNEIGQFFGRISGRNKPATA